MCRGSERSRRHHDLDWLRVIAFSLLILFHVGIGMKFGVMAVATFGITVLVYETLIRYTDPTRILFGMKPRPRIRPSD